MANGRIKRLLTLMATLAAALVFAAGCGGDDNNDGGGGGGNGPSIGGDTQQGDQPQNKEEAIDRCYEEAKKLEGQARETAEASCRAADTGDTDEVKEEAKEQCLEASKQIPNEEARKQAEEACERFGQ